MRDYDGDSSASGPSGGGGADAGGSNGVDGADVGTSGVGPDESRARDANANGAQGADDHIRRAWHLSGIGSAVFTGLSDSLDEVQAQLEMADGIGASQALTELDVLAAKIDSLRLTAVSRIEQSGVWVDGVNGTPASFLRSRHVRDHGQSRRDLRAAALAREFPVVAEATAAGKLSRAHVDVIVKVGLKTQTRSAELPDFLPMFVQIGINSPASTLMRVMKLWADQVDPIGGGDDDHDAHRRRYLHVNQVGDGVVLDGFFAPEAGAKICAVLNGVLAELFRSGEGTDPDSGMRVSTSVQRADALEKVMDRVLSSGQLPTAGGARAAVTVTVPIARLEDPCSACTDVNDLFNDGGDHSNDEVGTGGTDGAGLDGAGLDAAGHDGAGLGSAGLDGAGLDGAGLDGAGLDAAIRELEQRSAEIGVSNGPGTRLLSAQGAQRITCDCEIQRIVISPEGLPLDVGRRMRTFPAHMRKALEIRDRGCVFPGCEKPPGWTEAHHIVHWAQGGKTSLDNAALLCSNHHHRIHANNDSVVIDSVTGRATVIVNQRWRQ